MMYTMEKKHCIGWSTVCWCIYDLYDCMHVFQRFLTPSTLLLFPSIPKISLLNQECRVTGKRRMSLPLLKTTQTRKRFPWGHHSRIRPTHSRLRTPPPPQATSGVPPRRHPPRCFLLPPFPNPQISNPWHTNGKAWWWPKALPPEVSAAGAPPRANKHQ